jgi:hypothetical protein
MRVCSGYIGQHKGKVWRRAKDDFHDKPRPTRMGCQKTIEQREVLSQIGKRKNRLLFGKKVGRFTTNGELEKEYDSIRQVEEDGFSNVGVCKCCKGHLKKYRGFIWNYL